MANLGETIVKAPTGLAASDLEIGRLVTVSANKSTGDRSLVEMICEIVGGNEGHLLLACRGPGDTADDPPKPKLVAIHEYRFYPADHLASALSRSFAKSL